MASKCYQVVVVVVVSDKGEGRPTPNIRSTAAVSNPVDLLAEQQLRQLRQLHPLEQLCLQMAQMCTSNAAAPGGLEGCWAAPEAPLLPPPPGEPETLLLDFVIILASLLVFFFMDALLLSFSSLFLQLFPFGHLSLPLSP